MVVAAHHLARLTHHRPSPLHVQGNSLPAKTELLQIAPGLALHLHRDRRESLQPMHLPDAVDITRPSATRLGIALRIATQR